jgi:hypothetical protein
MKIVNMLRSVVALGRTRRGNHNRADDVLRGTTALVEEKVPEQFLSIPRWFAAACERYREVPTFFNPAMIEKQRRKAKDRLLFSTLKSPAQDCLSILVIRVNVSLANK